MKKLELFGVSYISQYVLMRYRREEEQFAYQVWITESIRLQPEGKRLGVSFREIIRPEPEKPVKTPEEIKAGIRAEFARLGGAQDGI